MTAETSSFYHSGINVKSDEPNWAANAKDGTDAVVRPLKLCSRGKQGMPEPRQQRLTSYLVFKEPLYSFKILIIAELEGSGEVSGLTGPLNIVLSDM